jgi:hypothetical protein
VNLQERVETL